MRLLVLVAVGGLAGGLSSCVFGTDFPPDCRPCEGNGRIDCTACSDGKVDCGGCDTPAGCETCAFTSRVTCPTCDGHGTLRCEACRGTGRDEGK